MSEKILFVDDEQGILDGFKRQLRKKFNLETALGGEEALVKVNEDGPFAVVISDKQMPGIDGFTLLSKIKLIHPETILIILTGYADLQSAIDAVNAGNLFRFLTKPCPIELLEKTIHLALLQYYLVTSEKDLCENTLSGCTKVLVEILGLVNPAVFGRSIRTRNLVRHMIERLNLDFAWKFELAAMLSQIGCVTLSPQIIEKLYAGETLTDSEQSLVNAHPHVAYHLLSDIPRLEEVAQMIETQARVFIPKAEDDDPNKEDRAALGGHLIRVALEFDKLILLGKSAGDAVAELGKHKMMYLPVVVSTLKDFEAHPGSFEVKSIRVKQVSIGMVLDEDIRTKEGLMIATKGQYITRTLLQRLRAFDDSLGGIPPFRVVDEEGEED